MRDGGRLGGRSRVPRDRRRLQRERRTASRRPAPVPRLVRHDPQEPRAERRVGPKAAERPVRLDERVLDGLLGVAAVTGGDERDSECDSLVHAHELLVGSRVAALRAHDERPSRPVVGSPLAPSTPVEAARFR